MEILYLITSDDQGGAQKYVLELATNFNGAVASGASSGLLQKECEQTSIPYYPLKHMRRELNPVQDLLEFWEIVLLIRKLKPAILHTNSSKAGFLGGLAGTLTRTPVIFTAHGFQYLEPMPKFKTIFYKFLHKIIKYSSDYIITVSEKERTEALKDKMLRPDKSETIYHGIKKINFLSKKEAREKLNIPQDTQVVGTIANFYHTKGLDTLLHAFANLTTLYPNSQLVVIGDGPERDQLLNLVNILKLNGKVAFTGQITNASALLLAFDVFTLPSRKEGLPYVLLEACQAGLPIVATDVGGNPEAAGPGALYTPKEEPKALSEALRKILANPTLKIELSRAGRAYSQKFTTNAMLAKTSRLYKQVLSRAFKSP